MHELVALAERFIRLSSEIEDVRRAMLACLSNGLDHDKASAPGQPAAAKPNGRDHDPPPSAPPAEVPKRNISSPPGRSPAPYAGNARRRKSPPATAQTAEQRLLAALQEHSGSTVIVLARAVGGGRSSVGERLRGLASRGVVTKDAGGHWRLVAELAGEPADPMPPPSS